MRETGKLCTHTSEPELPDSTDQTIFETNSTTLGEMFLAKMKRSKPLFVSLTSLRRGPVSPSVSTFTGDEGPSSTSPATVITNKSYHNKDRKPQLNCKKKEKRIIIPSLASQELAVASSTSSPLTHSPSTFSLESFLLLEAVVSSELQLLKH